MGLRQQKFWLKAIFRKPGLARWYFHWVVSQNGKRTPLGDQLPWVTYEAIDWLSKHLTRDMSLFEWGSGGSTLFFAQRVKQVITIEHDPAWYQEMINTINPDVQTNVSLRLITPVPSENIDIWYTSTDANFKGCSFEQYIRAIDASPDASFDVVMVDGRARPGCIQHAIPKVKPGGHLVLDNSDRLEYKHGMDLLFRWKCLSFFGLTPYVDFSTGTAIWQRSLELVD